MGEVLVGSRILLGRRYEYCLLSESISDRIGYGLKIRAGREEGVIRDVSCVREEVLALAETLVRCSVTPVSLRDVVEDWLGRD